MKTTTRDETPPPAAAPAPEPETTPQPAADIAATDQAMAVVAPTTELARPTVRMGVAPTTIEDAWRLSKFIADSEMVPKNYRKRPADVLVAIQLGMELGLPPMAALHSIFVANGQPSLYGDGFLAVIMASPVYQDHDEYYMVGEQRRDVLTHADMQKDDTAAVCTFWRRGSARPRTAHFSIANAKKANLWGKAGPWTEYASRMLKLRARGFAGRDAFPDVLRAIRIDAEVLDQPPAPPAPLRVLRRSETAEPPTPPVEAPPVIDPVRFGPVTVARVEQFLHDYTITLGDGTQIDTDNATDALDLEKLKTTKTAVRIECMADGDRLQLQSFAVAE